MSEAISNALPPRRWRCPCEASVHEGARFCWMCGAPVLPPPDETIYIGEENADDVTLPAAGERVESLDLQWAAWLALPGALAVTYGVYLVEPIYALLAGPALVIATIAALVHNLRARSAIAPGQPRPQATAGASLAVGAVTFAGTFMATFVIFSIIAIVVIVSGTIALLRMCGLMN